MRKTIIFKGTQIRRVTKQDRRYAVLHHAHRRIIFFHLRLKILWYVCDKADTWWMWIWQPSPLPRIICSTHLHLMVYVIFASSSRCHIHNLCSLLCTCITMYYYIIQIQRIWNLSVEKETLSTFTLVLRLPVDRSNQLSYTSVRYLFLHRKTSLYRLTVLLYGCNNFKLSGWQSKTSLFPQKDFKFFKFVFNLHYCDI